MLKTTRDVTFVLSGTLRRVVAEHTRLPGRNSSMAEALLVAGNGTNGSRG
jgi:hypothetical protein